MIKTKNYFKKNLIHNFYLTLLDNLKLNKDFILINSNFKN